MKIGVVYATGSKLPTMICVRDKEADLTEALAGPGHSFLVADDSELRHESGEAFHPDLIRKKIADHHGIDVRSIISGNCALVDPATGMVENRIVADPDVFKHPTHHVVASEWAGKGHKYDGKQFLASFVVADEKTGAVTDVRWLPIGSATSPVPGTVLVEGTNFKVGDKVPPRHLPVNVPSSGTTKL